MTNKDIVQAWLDDKPIEYWVEGKGWVVYIATHCGINPMVIGGATKWRVKPEMSSVIRHNYHDWKERNHGSNSSEIFEAGFIAGVCAVQDGTYC